MGGGRGAHALSAPPAYAPVGTSKINTSTNARHKPDFHERCKERKRKWKHNTVTYVTVKTVCHKRKLERSGDGSNGRFPFSTVFISATVELQSLTSP